MTADNTAIPEMPEMVPSAYDRLQETYINGPPWDADWSGLETTVDTAWSDGFQAGLAAKDSAEPPPSKDFLQYAKIAREAVNAWALNGNNGKGKYAVVRLRDIEDGSEAAVLLQRLYDLGHLDWGIVGEQDEFFVVKLRDEFANSALAGYAHAVMAASQKEPDPTKAKELAQWAIQVQALGHRAGPLSPFCKRPD